MPSEATLTLELATAPLLRAGSEVIAGLPPPDAALLAWLAIEGSTPRERMASLLWPASSAEAARNALRQRLFRLRRLAGRELVAGTVQLQLAEGVGHDLQGAATLLGGLRLPEHPELDEWLERQRAWRRSQGRQRLEARIEALEAAGDIAAALPLALQLVEADRLSEDAHRRVMRLHYLRGDRAAALLAFDRCEAILKDEVGAKPSAQTLALLATLDESAASAASEPVRGAQLPAALLRPPRLVGRDLELGRLQHARQTGAVVLVIGDAGMGKSRLLQVLAGLSPQAVLVSGRPGDSLVPYATLARLLKDLVERLPSAFDAALRRRLAPLLPSLAPEAAGRRPARAGLHGALAAPMAAALQGVRGELDTLVLDDLHFADTASLELLQALLAAPRGEQPLRWCLGLRPPEPGSPQQRLIDALAIAGPVVRVDLQALDIPALVELVDSLHLAGVSGAAIAPQLRQRSGGNPLYALETLKLAWADGSLHGPASALATPPSLAQLITQQLARLSPEALMLARLAAVAGVDFALPLAEQLLQRNALQLADAWHELESRQVLVGTEFAHDLIFEAVIAGVPAVIARHLHAQLAGWLEARRGEPARVAAHWEAAGERERALPGLRAAAERAHAALREPEHIAFLLRAAEIAEAAGRTDEAYDCVARAVDSHMNTIRHAEGYPLLDRLDGLAHTPAQRAAAWGQRAWYSIQLADQKTAIEAGERALALTIELGNQPQEAMLRQRLATALGMAGRFDEALAHLQTAEPTMLANPDAADRAEFHGNFAVLLDNLGRPREASAQRHKAIAAAREAGDAAHQVSQLANHAVSRLNAGDLLEAEDAIGQARRLIASYEMQGSTVGFVAVLRLQCARAACRYDEALAAADEAREVLAASNPARLPVVQLHEGHCWLEIGQHARAQQALQACAGALPGHFEARRLLLLARLAAQRGQPRREHLAAAQQVVPAQGWPDVALLAALEAAAEQETAAALAALPALLRRAQALDSPGLVLAVQVRLARHLADAAPAAAFDERLAIATSEALLAKAERYVPAFTYRAELYLQAARALEAAGAQAQARHARERGRQWVHEAAQQHLQPQWRDGFLQRNPTNLALLGGPAASIRPLRP